MMLYVKYYKYYHIITSHRIPCYMINVSIQFNTFQVRIQGLARDACIEHVHVMLGGFGSKTIIEISAVSHAEW